GIDQTLKDARRGDLQAVQSHLRRDPSLLLAKCGGHNRRFLWEATRGNRAGLVKCLLKAGADPNVGGARPQSRPVSGRAIGQVSLSPEEGTMSVRTIGGSLVVAWVLLCGLWSTAQEPKPKTGRVIGEVYSRKDTPDGMGAIVEVLAPGEVK